jgi:hypothetical protein
VKKLFTLAILSATLCARAQQAGVFTTFLNGGTNTVPALTTNTYANPPLIEACSEHPHFGFYLSCSCAAPTATNGSIVVKGFRSFDNGNSFETNPWQTWTNAFPVAPTKGFTNWPACFDCFATNATHILFQIGNTDTSLDVSNVTVIFHLPSTRVYAVPARGY